MIWPRFKIFCLAKTILQGTVKEKREEADRRRGGKTISKSGQEFTLPDQLGWLKSGQGGKGLLLTHLWSKIEQSEFCKMY